MDPQSIAGYLASITGTYFKVEWTGAIKVKCLTQGHNLVENEWVKHEDKFSKHNDKSISNMIVNTEISMLWINMQP